MALDEVLGRLQDAARRRRAVGRLYESRTSAAGDPRATESRRRPLAAAPRRKP